MDKSDLVIFVGKPCTGKTRMMELVKEVSDQILSNNIIKEIYISKIFPKAYNNQYLFEEVELYSKVQFYSIYHNIFHNYYNRCLFLQYNKRTSITSNIRSNK